MNGIGIDARDVFIGILTLAVGVMAFFGKREIERLDRLDAEAVRKRELKELEERIETSRNWMHAENKRAFDDVNQNISKTGNRIDDLFRDLMRRHGGDR